MTILLIGVAELVTLFDKLATDSIRAATLSDRSPMRNCIFVQKSEWAVLVK